MCREMEKIYSEGMVKISEKDVQKWIDENLCTMK